MTLWLSWISVGIVEKALEKASWKSSSGKRIYWFSPYLGSGDNKQLGNKHEPGDGYKVFEHRNNADRGWNSYEVYELITNFVI